MWKAQQDNDSDDSFYDDEDSSSIDTWEKSDTDDEDTFESLETEEDDDQSMIPIIRPLKPKTLTDNEELDFNDVVFCIEYESGSRDEGYISASPPVSPVLGLFADGCEWQRQPTGSLTRPKAAMRVDSMDALDELGLAEEYDRASECSEADMSSVELAETSQNSTKSDKDTSGTEVNSNMQVLETTHRAEPVITLNLCTSTQSHQCSAVEATIWQDMSDDFTTSTPSSDSPTSSYTQLEQSRQRQPLQLQIVYLTSFLFTGLLYIIRSSIGILTAGVIVQGQMGNVPQNGRVLELD